MKKKRKSKVKSEEKYTNTNEKKIRPIISMTQ